MVREGGGTSGEASGRAEKLNPAVEEGVEVEAAGIAGARAPESAMAAAAVGVRAKGRRWPACTRNWEARLSTSVSRFESVWVLVRVLLALVLGWSRAQPARLGEHA